MRETVKTTTVASKHCQSCGNPLIGKALLRTLKTIRKLRKTDIWSLSNHLRKQGDNVVEGSLRSRLHNLIRLGLIKSRRVRGESGPPYCVYYPARRTS